MRLKNFKKALEDTDYILKHSYNDDRVIIITIIIFYIIVYIVYFVMLKIIFLAGYGCGRIIYA